MIGYLMSPVLANVHPTAHQNVLLLSSRICMIYRVLYKLVEYYIN